MFDLFRFLFLAEKLTTDVLTYLVTYFNISIHTLEFRINNLFVYSGHFVIQEGRGDIVFLFWNNKRSWINE